MTHDAERYTIRGSRGEQVASAPTMRDAVTAVRTIMTERPRLRYLDVHDELGPVFRAERNRQSRRLVFFTTGGTILHEEDSVTTRQEAQEGREV